MGKSKKINADKGFLVEFCIDYTDGTSTVVKFSYPFAKSEQRIASFQALFDSLYEKIIINSLEQTGNSPEMIKDIGITILQP